MKPYRTILCPTDFSEPGRAALQRARELAGHYGAELILLHVIDYFPGEIPNDWIPPEDEDPKAYLQSEAERRLQALADELAPFEVRREVLFSDTSARHAIGDYAARTGVDLVVLASHARHGAFSLLGSTAAGVAHTAPCDVMVVRALRS